MLIDGLAGLLTGVLSGLGIGGGTLLMLYMTLWGGLEQHMAQGVNLLYFVPCAASALFLHIKNKQVEFKAAWTAIAAGLASGALGAWAVRFFDAALLRRGFAVLVIFIGLRESFKRE